MGPVKEPQCILLPLACSSPMVKCREMLKRRVHPFRAIQLSRTTVILYRLLNTPTTHPSLNQRKAENAKALGHKGDIKNLEAKASQGARDINKAMRASDANKAKNYKLDLDVCCFIMTQI